MRNCSIDVNTSPEVAIWLKEVQSSLVVMGLLGGFPYRHWGRGTSTFKGTKIIGNF